MRVCVSCVVEKIVALCIYHGPHVDHVYTSQVHIIKVLRWMSQKLNSS